MVVAVVALVFSSCSSGTRGSPAEIWDEYCRSSIAGVAFLIGIPVYLAQRTHMTEPEPVPAYR